MKKQKYCLAAGALFCTSVLGAFSPALQTYAATFDNSTDGSSYFDTNAQACIVENYNTENSTSITSIEQIDVDKITTLDCSNRGIKNFRGVTLLGNLEVLNVSGNPNLNTSDLDFVIPKNLKTLNIVGSGIVDSDGEVYIDISENTKLENIRTSSPLKLKTSTYIEKLNSEAEYAYGMDLSGLKFINSIEPTANEEYPSKYDTETKTISYESKIPNSVLVEKGDYKYNILSRGGTMQSFLYFKDGDKKESGPISVQDNCEEDKDGVISCNNTVYYGDVIDTEAFVKSLGLSDYALSKVEIIPPKANVDLTVNEDAVKKGIVLADADITLKYHFDIGNLAVPDTGAFTAGGPTIVATTATVAIALTGITMYVSRHATKRQKAKVHFGKK